MLFVRLDFPRTETLPETGRAQAKPKSARPPPQPRATSNCLTGPLWTRRPTRVHVRSKATRKNNRVSFGQAQGSTQQAASSSPRRHAHPEKPLTTRLPSQAFRFGRPSKTRSSKAKPRTRPSGPNELSACPPGLARHAGCLNQAAPQLAPKTRGPKTTDHLIALESVSLGASVKD